MFPSVPSRGRRRGRERTERQGHGPQMFPALHDLCFGFLVGEEEGTITHPCLSHPLSQSTPATSATPTPPQALWPVVHKATPLRAAPLLPAPLLPAPLLPAPLPPAPLLPAPLLPAPLPVSHSLSCELCDLWTDTGSSVCVCVNVIAR